MLGHQLIPFEGPPKNLLGVLQGPIEVLMVFNYERKFGHGAPIEAPPAPSLFLLPLIDYTKRWRIYSRCACSGWRLLFLL